MDLHKLHKILNDNLNSVNRTTRTGLSNVLKDEIFVPVYDMSLRDMKDLAFKRLQKITQSKIVSIRDFLKDPDNIFTTHEMVTFH
jgi:acyl-CoA oxidase